MLTFVFVYILSLAHVVGYRQTFALQIMEDILSLFSKCVNNRNLFPPDAEMVMV